MKIRMLMLAATVAAAIYGCSSSTYRLEGNVKNTAVKKVYLMKLKSGTVDTAFVEGGKFSFKGSVEEPELASLETSNGLGMPVIIENGKVRIQLDSAKVEGGKFNTELNTMNDRITEVSEGVQKKFMEVKDNKDIDINEFMTKFIEDSVKPKAESIILNTLKANKANPLGAFSFIMSINMGLQEEHPEIVETLDPKILEYKDIAKIVQDVKAQSRTVVGKKFVDFKVEKGGAAGETVSLSDYVGKGKYVLVDFFASWCGPCKAELVYIKEVYEKYAGKNLEVLGVALWDKIEDTKKAVEAEGMTWPIIYNAQNLGTDLYGITGVPHLMLIAPDGTIVERGFRGAAMVEKVAEYMNKK